MVSAVSPSRRMFLACSAGALAVLAGAAAAGLELVSHGVLPGKAALDWLDGACSVSAPAWSFATPLGPAVSGTFYSAARERVVGYSIGYPPGHHQGDELPL